MHPLHLSQRHVVHITLAVVLGIMVVMSLISDDAYRLARGEASYTLSAALGRAEHKIADYGHTRDDIQLALRNSAKILADTEGKVADEATRSQLITVGIAAQTSAAVQEPANQELVDEFVADTDDFSKSLYWPPNAFTAARRLDRLPGADVDEMLRAVVAIGEAIGKVQNSNAAWQAVQDRIAAERAAAAEREAAEREAAAKRAATKPVSPSAPSTPAPSVSGFNAEAYVRALAPNSYISWVPGLCGTSFVCGRAWIGGTAETPVKIDLDPAKLDIYSNRVGRSVLVHEAAHARQWATYGPSLIPTSEAQTGLSGIPAVEYMADCATIGKLGYSTGTYATSCTASQLSAIAVIW